MVNALNFGGYEGEDQADRKKTREERHAEIMEKSKAFRYHSQQIKEANEIATRELDEEWNDVAALLTFRQKDNEALPADALKDEQFDSVLARLKTESGIQKVQPQQVNLTER